MPSQPSAPSSTKHRQPGGIESPLRRLRIWLSIQLLISSGIFSFVGVSLYQMRGIFTPASEYASSWYVLVGPAPSLILVGCSNGIGIMFYLVFTIRLFRDPKYIPSVVAYGLALAIRWGAVMIIFSSLLFSGFIPHLLLHVAALFVDIWILYNIHQFTTQKYVEVGRVLARESDAIQRGITSVIEA